MEYLYSLMEQCIVMEKSMLSTNRIDVVDALRGFAVMAILLVHSLEHFIYPVYPTGSPSWLQAIDNGVLNVVFTLFAGKSYSIFALLFGFTFFIQSDNQKQLGLDFGKRFLWRLVILVGFATLNAAFFPAGDVLLLFVVVGVVLFVARNWSNRAIFIAALFFLFQPMEWFHFVASLIVPGHQLPNLHVGEMYAEVAEYIKAGNFIDFIKVNITLGQKASLLWAVNAGRFFQTAGLFLLGFYLGRKGLFIANDQNKNVWVKILIVSSILFAPLYVLKEQAMQGEVIVGQSLGTVLDMWQKLAFTLVLVASFVLLYQNSRFSNAVDNLRYYGKMSLTNYVSQSIIGALIYFPIGLHLAPHCGYALSLFVGIAVFILQLRFSMWWFSSRRYGPLEFIWHKLTWIGRR
jgi:uncharacterized protein